MLKIIVLGTAAGGGVPQWNCNCAGCRAARARPELVNTQASIAVSADDKNWFLINASPDIRQQINATKQLHPAAGQIRHNPIAGVILTNGEVDAVAGLLNLREGSPFTIYGHDRVLSVLEGNSIFNVLNRDLVPRQRIEIDAAFEPELQDGTPSGLTVETFEVPGKPAWYLEGTAQGTHGAGDTIGLHLRETDGSKGFYFIAACGQITDALKQRIDGAPLVFFDGTLWRDDEMIAAGLSHKTGQRMGHVSISGGEGALARLADLDIPQKLFIHINNSNPVLRPESDERRHVEAAGWRIPTIGEEIEL
ncbi:pyrroloquinoline quinone biosynthesis protein PqqB [Roseovarius sp. M141]|uniref:pyrroloquinoline quinone biosynthesis protein PqqB n=1 Tax=Roseovarius sp. M141 TaxID=2583806 RepID=UPI0020CBB31A|nr:pyrroloquinoline quinone biosynthesis protein PqqB [Roseovarius sp. M141]MCQ0093102.1 pyrroloquinoline quinone biosynthesis protein PqqB [Roseovarius sp. M141]